MSALGALGSRKLRRAEEATGERLVLAVALSHAEIECVTPEDRHLIWNRRTGDVRPVESRSHFRGCPTVLWAS